jgi:alkanesulfonate monooxygenase SsuD/methylene tetrahydromethanopterin reductase-like flavin-dependent oxidoreductase (luciferase family)
VRVGVSIPNRHPDADVVVPYALAVAREAGRGGADLLMVGDKRSESQPLAQGAPLLGRLLAEAHGVPDVAALFLASLWDEGHLLDTIGTLSALAVADGARLTAVLALGRSGRPAADRIQALEGAVEAVRALPVPGRSELGHAPPVWLAAERPAAVRRAAMLGDGWIANAGYDLAALDRQLEVVRCAGPPERFRLAVRRDIVCGSSDADALEEGRRLLATGYRGFGPGTLVAGDPRRCAAELRRLADLGFDTVVVRPASLDPTSGVESVRRLLGEAVAVLEDA